MTAGPSPPDALGARNFGLNNPNTQRIPVNEVRAGFSLAVDRGRGYQLFQVENVTVKETRDDDGNRVVAWTLTSGPVHGSAEPWVLELPDRSIVIRVLPPT